MSLGRVTGHVQLWVKDLRVRSGHAVKDFRVRSRVKYFLVGLGQGSKVKNDSGRVGSRVTEIRIGSCHGVKDFRVRSQVKEFLVESGYGSKTFRSGRVTVKTFDPVLYLDVRSSISLCLFFSFFFFPFPSTLFLIPFPSFVGHF